VSGEAATAAERAAAGAGTTGAGAAGGRRGGHVVAESLAALGAGAVFGVPGIHALSIWDALPDVPLRTLGFRTELGAAFAADGYARASGRPAPLLLSTGPGALNALTGLMEAATAHVPVVAVSSQEPRALLGRGRGFLHELPDQRAVFAPVVKHAARAESAEGLPEMLAAAWRAALTPPSGPVYVEIPVDVLEGAADVPVPEALDGDPPPPRAARREAVAEAARLLAAAERPVLWAGGGVERSGAWEELAALAERLDAPVATTYMGKGAFPADHPLSAGSGCDEAAFQELVGGADVVLAVGTELGAETTGQYELRFAGRLIHADAAPERMGATYGALGLVGDARATLAALLEAAPGRTGDEAGAAAHARHGDEAGAAARGTGAARAAAVRERIARGLDAQGRELERGLLADVAAAAGPDAQIAWDMTILAYWAAAHFPQRRRRGFLYPLGSGTLGYAWPAALGAQAALPEARTLAVAGDGGILYALPELAGARQHGLRATLVIVDDGGYGILREYQADAYGRTHAVDLVQPDFAAVAAGFGVPARTCRADGVAEALAWGIAEPGPAVVVLRETLVFAEPTP
jgi:acetolactate synthase-1/2/3 large subunit